MTLKPNLLKAFLIGGIVFLFSFLIRFVSFGTAIFNKSLYIFFLYCMLYSVVLYIVNASIFTYLDKVFKDNRFSNKRIFIGFISSFFISLFVVFLLRIFTNVVIEKRPILSFLANEEASTYIENSVITFIILLIFHALHFLKYIRKTKLYSKRLLRERQMPSSKV